MAKKTVKKAARALKKKNKTLYYIVVAAVIIAAIYLYVYFYLNAPDPLPDEGTQGGTKGDATETTSTEPYKNAAGELAVHFIDVGQGDGIYIEFPSGKDMLIDGGETPLNNDGAMLDYLKEVNEDNKIDYLIVTHADADHCNKLVPIIEYFEIGAFYLPYATIPDYSVTTATPEEIALFTGGKESSTATYRNLLIAAFNEENSTINVVAGNFDITIEDSVSFLVYSLDKEEYAEKGAKSNVNEQSPICILTYRERRIVLTGDAEGKSEADYLEDSDTLDCDVLKAGHHGSNTSSSEAFLTDISCEYAVISVGEGNSYGHPDADILAAMEARNMTVYTTIDYGNVVAVISDAGALTFVTEKVPSAEISA